MGNHHQTPVKESLWRVTEKGPHLIGSHCLTCNEMFFPRKDNGLCTHCQSRNLEEIEFSNKGKVFSHTCVMQRPPVYYKGEVPYALGFVELPEGIRIETLFTNCDFEALHVGMEMEMVIEKLHVDENGTVVETYKFQPVR